MSKYRIIRSGDGWSDPIYADEYGNIVSKERVEQERLKEKIKAEIKQEIQPDTSEALKAEALKMAMARKAVLEWEYEKSKKERGE